MLSDQEKERVRYHLGYIETSLAATLQYGIPRPQQTAFLLELALERLVDPFAVERCRGLLNTLDSIECKLRESADYVVAESIGQMKLHPLASRGKLASDSLESEYVRWAYRLADMLGVPVYAFSQRFRRGGPGSMIPVG